MLGLLEPLIFSGIIGWVLLRIVLRPQGRLVSTLFAVGVGFPLGSGVYTIVEFLLMNRFPTKVRLPWLAFYIAGIISGSLALWLWRRRVYNPKTIGAPAFRTQQINRILVGLALIAAAAALTMFVVEFQLYPQGLWDAHAIWNSRARVMFRDPMHWRTILSEDHPHPDYPLLLSLMVFNGWRSFGGEPPVWPELLGCIFMASALLCLGVTVTVLKDLRWGLIAAALLLSSGGYLSLAAAQYSDVPLSGFYVAAFGAFLLAYWREEQANFGLLILAGSLAAMCGWVKNEGLSVAPSLFVGLALVGLPERNWLARSLKRFQGAVVRGGPGCSGDCPLQTGCP